MPMTTLAVRAATETAARYVLLNQKGGVGKTQLAWQLGRELAELGLRVLMVDLDPQGNLSYALGLLPAEDAPENDATLSTAMTGKWREGDPRKGGDPMVLTRPYPHHPNLHLLPWDWDHFTMVRTLDVLEYREARLSRVLTWFDGLFDVILLDCPPSLDIITDNALHAVRDGRGKVLIPVEAEDFSLRATRILLSQIETKEENSGLDIDIAGFVLGKMTDTKLAKDCEAKLRSIEHIEILATVRHRTEIQQCVREHKALRDHAPDNDQLPAFAGLAKRMAA
ncbi:AAA family ATPase [Streptacidiphilus sp. 4-A2]|jgi:chromosome partitioning protein|nr:AAA family ATPase [Streptacidiphilus sp. 4-A2]